MTTATSTVALLPPELVRRLDESLFTRHRQRNDDVGSIAHHVEMRELSPPEKAFIVAEAVKLKLKPETLESICLMKNYAGADRDNKGRVQRILGVGGTNYNFCIFFNSAGYEVSEIEWKAEAD